MSNKPTEYISLGEAMIKLNSYMKSRGYNLFDYELTSIGHGSCTLDNSPTIWYHTFCLREYANPDHEININIPCYKTEAHISCELLSRECGLNKE